MKHFIYTYHEGKPPRDGSGIARTVRVYAIIQGTPKFLASHTETFASEFQLVMAALKRAPENKGYYGDGLLPRGGLPKKAFDLDRYGTFLELREAGIANINGVR
jgi:hypothetical protein